MRVDRRLRRRQWRQQLAGVAFWSPGLFWKMAGSCALTNSSAAWCVDAILNDSDRFCELCSWSMAGACIGIRSVRALIEAHFVRQSSEWHGVRLRVPLVIQGFTSCDLDESVLYTALVPSLVKALEEDLVVGHRALHIVAWSIFLLRVPCRSCFFPLRSLFSYTLHNTFAAPGKAKTQCCSCGQLLAHFCTASGVVGSDKTVPSGNHREIEVLLLCIPSAGW
mmetsp:Transcript_2129/g.3880  ORF Transcript_2129/g.3880 Transcript_2129/m.3880 type:complete len:222 (-) Transcript_2129:488-1153(-)